MRSCTFNINYFHDHTHARGHGISMTEVGRRRVRHMYIAQAAQGSLAHSIDRT